MIIVLSLLLVVFLGLKIGDVFAPWTITVAVWLAILLMYQAQDGLLYPLGDQFKNCVMLWVPIFCVTALITYAVMPKAEQENKGTAQDTGIPPVAAIPTTATIPPYNSLLFDVLYFISMVITPQGENIEHIEDAFVPVIH